MIGNKKYNEEKETNLIKVLTFKYFPYWPLFVILVILFLGVAYFYTHNKPPAYQISAAVLINDQNKGIYDGKLTEAFNNYKMSKIVENETEVLHSRPLAKEVATTLNLYTPVYEKGNIWPISAYLTSPITVKLLDVDKSAAKLKEDEKFYFTYNGKDKTVDVRNKRYKLNEWVETPFGTAMFLPNAKQKDEAKRPLYFQIASTKEAVTGILAELEAAQVTRFSSVVTLTYYDEVPERGEDILNEVIKAYDRQSLMAKNKMAANTVAFIEDRIRNAQQEVNSLESRIKDYKSRQGIVNLSEQGNLFLKNVSDNDQKIAGINMQLAVLDQVERYVQSKNNSSGIVPSTLGVDDPTLSKLLDKLYESEIQYEKLRKTTAENNPILLSLKNETEKIRPSIMESIKNQRSALTASRQNLSVTNGTAASVLKTIPEKERALLEINRQQAIKNDVYTFLLQKREETALSLTNNDVENRVVDWAEAGIKPESPKKKIIYLGSIAFALVLGIGLVNAKEFFSSKVLFRSEIEEATEVPIVAEIANVRNKKPFVVNDSKALYVTEQFRQLKAAIGLYNKNNKKKKILVTSGVSGEGKSFISSNLALSLAMAGKKVVLIDLDLRNPRTTRTFEGKAKGKNQAKGYIANNSTAAITEKSESRQDSAEQRSAKNEVLNLNTSLGVMEYLRDNLEPYEVIKKTAFDNLFIVPAGALAHDPTELLLSDKLESLFSYLENTFDYIIADTSPIDPVTDPYILSNYFNTTLYVVRHGHTPKRMLEMLDESYKIKALKDLVIVFNGVKSRGFMTRGFGLGYGYGYENVYNNRVYTGRV